MRSVRFVLPLAFALLSAFSLLAAADTRARAAESPCAAARALQGLQRVDAAEGAYLEVLKERGGSRCATVGLAHLAGEPKKPKIGYCTKGDALADAGQKEKAEASYAKVLEAKPTSECAMEGLEKLKSDQGFWEWVATAGKNLGSGLAFVGIAIASALVFLQIVVWLVTHAPWLNNRRWVSRWLFHTGLQVNPLDDSWMQEGLGAQVAGLMREPILQDGQGGPRLVSGETGLGDSLKPLAEVAPEARAAVAAVVALASVRRRRNFEIGGALQPRGENGRGLSIELTCEKDYLASSTLWGREFEVPPEETVAYQQLATPAAAWVQHQIATKLHSGDLLSNDPHSWALFKAGTARQAGGDLPLATDLYSKALDKDPRNVGALINLGVFALNDRAYDRASDLLELALSQLSESHLDVKKNPNWYTAKYDVAALHINWTDSLQAAGLGDNERAAHRHTANRHAWELAEKAAQQLTYRWPSRTKPKLRERLASQILPGALLIYAGSSSPPENPAGAASPTNMRDLHRRLKTGRLTAEEAMAFVTAYSKPSSSISFLFACAHAHRGETDLARERLSEAIDLAYSDDAKKKTAIAALTDAAFDGLLADPESADLRTMLETLLTQ